MDYNGVFYRKNMNQRLVGQLVQPLRIAPVRDDFKLRVPQAAPEVIGVEPLQDFGWGLHRKERPLFKRQTAGAFIPNQILS